MTNKRDRRFLFLGLGVSLVIAALLSPFASSNPDGLDRVAQDYEFEDRALEDAPATKLPFYGLFEEYSLRNVPPGMATPLAGLVGTLATFGLAWGAGKLLVRNAEGNSSEPQPTVTTADDSEP